MLFIVELRLLFSIHGETFPECDVPLPDSSYYFLNNPLTQEFLAVRHGSNFQAIESGERRCWVLFIFLFNIHWQRPSPNV